MGIAKYFSKDLLAINKLLNADHTALVQILNSKVIGIAFDANAASTFEGSSALDLTVRLIARLYPRISIVDLSLNHQPKKIELINLARSINSNIEIVEDTNSINILLIAGAQNSNPILPGKKVYIGSSGWTANFSSRKSLTFGNSRNPFGAGLAACIATSNVFRFVFSDLIPGKSLDDEVAFSPLDESESGALQNQIQIPNVVLVGLGAIGNGFIWSMSKLPDANGEIDVVEPEAVSMSNLQRYVLFEERHVGAAKIDCIAGFFTNPALKINLYRGRWADYLNHKGNWEIENVAVAIDNKRDRINIQSSLPRRIFNAYTEENLVGIARHLNFLETSCLACGYIPSIKERNYTEEVAINCHVHPNVIKDYLNHNLTVDAVFQNYTVSLLDMIAKANHIDRQLLNQFHGKRVPEFYSDFICGGISLALAPSSAVEIKNIDAPLAFQSAMAGILLAAEIIVENNGLRRVTLKQQSHFYPLNPFSAHNPYQHNLEKDASGRCICADETFKKQYQQKWFQKRVNG